MTAVELVIVLAIVGLMTTLAVPPAVQAMSKASLNRATDDLSELILEAQARARGQALPAPDPNDPTAARPHYGISIAPTGDGRYRVALLSGGTSADVVLGEEKPSEAILPRDIQIQYSEGLGMPTALDKELTWFFAYGSGQPIAAPGVEVPVSVGRDAQSRSWITTLNTPASPVCTLLRVAAADGRNHRDVALDTTGTLLVSEGG
ncbi:MAG: type II secretion system protein [Planctomycetota bacterium]|nr:type II secretion system protein [Planctomycetota bacterium]